MEIQTETCVKDTESERGREGEKEREREGDGNREICSLVKRD